MADTVKVRFVRDYQVQDEEATVYESGKSYTMPEASAQHFVRRGAAVIDDGRKRSRGGDEPDAGDASGG